MAAPVSVIHNPRDDEAHLLYFLNSKQQLALEQRPVIQPASYTRYNDYGVSQGVIVNPSSLAAVNHWNLVTVYGITQPNPTDPKNPKYISKLAPFYNLVPDADSGKPIQTTQKALAATSNDGGINWVYYIEQHANSLNQWKIHEVEIDDVVGKDDILGNSAPLKNANLAAVWSPETQNRFVITHGEDGNGDNYLFWISSANGSQNIIQQTGGVVPGGPLAIAQIPIADNGEGAPGLRIVLYYQGNNHTLNRIVGEAHGDQIDWPYANESLSNAPRIDDTTLMTATNHKGTQNYVYYMEKGKNEFRPFVDVVGDKWFTPSPPK
ncbi:hypothetical protein BBP40_002378 [Aspergillus hancockii]|nr:hypothetical protein BBP40_002378 [Aspergillus hancockii]